MFYVKTAAGLVDGDDYEFLEENSVDASNYQQGRRGRALPYSVHPEVLGKHI